MPRHKGLRLRFARAYHNVTVNHWCHVLFGDEFRFVLHRVGGQMRVMGLQGEALHVDSRRLYTVYCNNPGVLVAPVWLSHVCLTGFDVLWERPVSVWWLGIDWRHFHVADRIEISFLGIFYYSGYFITGRLLYFGDDRHTDFSYDIYLQVH